MYRYEYAFSHTSNDLEGFYSVAATWSGRRELPLWGAWTAIIGFLALREGGP